MTYKEKMQSLEDHMCNYCSYNPCDECEFFEPEDDTDGNYFCGIRDNNKKIPFHKGWNVNEGLGIRE